AISECLTCDGISPPIGRAICQLEAGIVAGALETIYPGRKALGEETKCIGGLGDDVCLIECRII
ncbi:MAG: V4R domain-containing protein, partial [Patescibacteria group bacterium]